MTGKELIEIINKFGIDRKIILKKGSADLQVEKNNFYISGEGYIVITPIQNPEK